MLLGSLLGQVRLGLVSNNPLVKVLIVTVGGGGGNTILGGWLGLFSLG